MKSIYEILTGIGIEIPEDKKETFDKEWKENYRTKTEYDNAVKKRDEYKLSLDGVQETLDGFKDIDVDDLKGQVDTLTKELRDEKEARIKDAARVELDKNVRIFLSGKKFVNALTEKSIRENLMDELDKDTAKGKSIEDIFKSLITDADGNEMENILVDESQQQAQKNMARFTMPIKGSAAGTEKDKFKTMSLDERMKLKQSNPELYNRMKG